LASGIAREAMADGRSPLAAVPELGQGVESLAGAARGLGGVPAGLLALESAWRPYVDGKRPLAEAGLVEAIRVAGKAAI
jgi:hypothetical protein